MRLAPFILSFLLIAAKNVKIRPGIYAIMSTEVNHGKGKYVAEKSPMHLFVKSQMGFGAYICGFTGAIFNALIAIPFHYYLRSDALVLSYSRMIRWELKPIRGSEENEFILRAVFEATEDQVYLSASANLKKVEKTDPIPLIAIDAGHGQVYLQLQDPSGPRWLYAGTKREWGRVYREAEKNTTWKFIPQEYLPDLPVPTVGEATAQVAVETALLAV